MVRKRVTATGLKTRLPALTINDLAMLTGAGPPLRPDPAYPLAWSCSPFFTAKGWQWGLRAWRDRAMRNSCPCALPRYPVAPSCEDPG